MLLSLCWINKNVNPSKLDSLYSYYPCLLYCTCADKLPVDDTGDVEEILDEVSDADVISKPQQVTAEEEGHHYGKANNQVG